MTWLCRYNNCHYSYNKQNTVYCYGNCVVSFIQQKWTKYCFMLYIIALYAFSLLFLQIRLKELWQFPKNMCIYLHIYLFLFLKVLLPNRNLCHSKLFDYLSKWTTVWLPCSCMSPLLPPSCTTMRVFKWILWVIVSAFNYPGLVLVRRKSDEFLACNGGLRNIGHQSLFFLEF